jgi:hypothetical protein
MGVDLTGGDNREAESLKIEGIRKWKSFVLRA